MRLQSIHPAHRLLCATRACLVSAAGSRLPSGTDRLAWILAGLGLLATLQAQAEPLKVTFTYPYASHTTPLKQMRYAGYTHPGARLYINGIPHALSSLGSFAGLMPLSVGENVLLATASLKGEIASARLVIVRTPPPDPPPTHPWRINQRLCLPKTDVWIRPPGSLTVRCVGSPRGKATFSIGLLDDQAMDEISPGVYEGTLAIRTFEPWQKEPVKFELTTDNPRKKTRATAPGSVTILGTGPPVVLEISDEEPVPLYRTAQGRTRYVDLPPGVRLEAVGLMGRRYEVYLSPVRRAYVEAEQVNRLPDGTPPPETTIQVISTQVDPDRTIVRIPLSQRLPYIVTEETEPPRLDLRIYGARSDTWWITGRHNDGTIKSLKQDVAPDGGYRLLMTLHHDHWGYLPYYEGTTLCLEVKAPPNLPDIGRGGLKGLVVAIDPGHGGHNRGARAPTGIWEKDVNRRLSPKLERRIRALGGETVVLRQGDEDISLRDRILRARRSGAHILLSIHNNTVGDDSDPMASRGTSTYYYHPHSEQLSRKIYENLLSLPGLTPWGHVGRFDFAPIRDSTDMLGVLVECVFLSHPDDEAIILGTESQNRITQAIADGLVKFLQERLDGERSQSTGR